MQLKQTNLTTLGALTFIFAGFALSSCAPVKEDSALSPPPSDNAAASNSGSNHSAATYTPAPTQFQPSAK